MLLLKEEKEFDQPEFQTKLFLRCGVCQSVVEKITFYNKIAAQRNYSMSMIRIQNPQKENSSHQKPLRTMNPFILHKLYSNTKSPRRPAIIKTKKISNIKKLIESFHSEPIQVKTMHKKHISENGSLT